LAASELALPDILDKKLLKECVHCGLCLDYCPTYRLLSNEADSPRGRIYQIRQVYEGKVSPDDADTADHRDARLADRYHAGRHGVAARQ